MGWGVISDPQTDTANFPLNHQYIWCAQTSMGPQNLQYICQLLSIIYLLNFVICCYYQSDPGYKLHPPGCYYFLFFICNSLLFVAIINQPQFLSFNPSSCYYYFFHLLNFVYLLLLSLSISCTPLVVIKFPATARKVVTQEWLLSAK